MDDADAVSAILPSLGGCTGPPPPRAACAAPSSPGDGRWPPSFAVVAVVARAPRPVAPAARPDAVLTAAHDLAAGVVVGATDLRRTPYDPDVVPGRVVADAALPPWAAPRPGRSAPGEPLTDARLVTASLLAGYPGLVAVPVRIGDPGRRPACSASVTASTCWPPTRRATGGRRCTSWAATCPCWRSRVSASESAGLTSGALVVLGVPAASTRTSPRPRSRRSCRWC